MPKGDDQAGKRRGPYKARQRAADEQGAPEYWSDSDKAHYRELLEASPLTIKSAKENAARRATELARQLIALDSRPRTTEEEKVMSSVSSQYRKWLEALRVMEKVNDDEGEL